MFQKQNSETVFFFFFTDVKHTIELRERFVEFQNSFISVVNEF